MVAPKLFICPSAAFNRGPGSAFVCLSTSLQPFFLVFLFCCLKRPLSDNSMFVFVHSFLWYFLVCRNDVGLGCVQGYVWLTRSFSFLPSEFHIAGQALPQLRWMPWPLQVRSHQNVGRQATLPSGKEMCGVPRSGLDSVLLLYDPHVLSLSSSLEITNVLIKDLLRYTETWAQLRLSLKLWFLSFYKISTGSVCGPGPGNLPVEFSVSWSRAGLRCHPFLPQCSAELFIAPHCRSSHFCFLIMLNEETDGHFRIFSAVCFQECSLPPFYLPWLLKSVNFCWHWPLVTRVTGDVPVVVWCHM